MKLNLQLFTRLALLFAVTQALAIYVARQLLPTMIAPVAAEFSFYDLLILILVIVIFILISTKFKQAGPIFYKVFLSILIFGGSQSVLSIWFDPIISTLAAIVLLIVFWTWQNIFIHDLAMVFTLSGIGAAIGLSLTPQVAAWILVGLSFYDIIAVYKTKHMIKLAESMIQSRAIFGFVVPPNLRAAGEHISQVAPGGQFMILGSGDVILPIILAASLVRYSLSQAVIIAVFAVGGLFLMHLIFTNQKIKRPMAALPPIAAASIIGYLVSILL